MQNERITDWLHAILMMELAIKNSICNSTGLSPAYMWDSNQNAYGYTGQDIGWYFQYLRDLGNAGYPGAGIQASAARLEGLEAPRRQALQAY